MPDLFAAELPVPREASRFRYFVGLDIAHPSFARLAAGRIAEMADPVDVEAALHELPRDFLVWVESMAVMGIAFRIAQLSSLDERRAALTQVPESLRARVDPQVKSYYESKPWLRKPRDE